MRNPFLSPTLSAWINCTTPTFQLNLCPLLAPTLSAWFSIFSQGSLSSYSPLQYIIHSFSARIASEGTIMKCWNLLSFCVKCCNGRAGGVQPSISADQPFIPPNGSTQTIPPDDVISPSPLLSIQASLTLWFSLWILSSLIDPSITSLAHSLLNSVVICIHHIFNFSHSFSMMPHNGFCAYKVS